jgi:Putative zinc-finger
VNCLDVRERLPEYSLSSLPPRDASTVGRHLAWCAACRKESEELRDGAAVIGFAAAGPPPPPRLGGRVEDLVERHARRHSATHRRLRVASAIAVAATIVAVVVTASSLWWGTVVAKRADPAATRADRLTQSELVEQEFEHLLQGLPGSRTQARIATLVAPHRGSGRGWGFVMLSPSGRDIAGVNVVGLASKRRALPYKVWISNGRAGRVLVGTIDSLDSSGEAEMFRRVDIALDNARTFVVERADGAVSLSGPIGSRGA